MDTNLVALVEQFGADDSRCRAYLEALKWPDGVRCPRCPEKTTISQIADRDTFDCDSCRYQFSVTAGTIFNDTHLPLWKWFLGVYLMCEAQKGVSANQLGHSIKVAYKTAWYLCHRIREAMAETNPARIGREGATVGMKKRGDKTALHGGYIGMIGADTSHESVNHGVEEWVRGDVHTNGIGGVSPLFNRSIVGSYHNVSAKHLDRYLGELEWRFNQRENPFLFRDTLMRLLTTKKIAYRELIEKSA
jgi:transposase-like protein